MLSTSNSYLLINANAMRWKACLAQASENIR